MSDATPTLSAEQIDELRLKAFKTNEAQDITSYFYATHKWFSDRHYRDSSQIERMQTAIKQTLNTLYHCVAFTGTSDFDPEIAALEQALKGGEKS